MQEVDYWEKLSSQDRQYLEQFMFEYYQADFSFNTNIHPEDLIKDCRDRNNADKRQIDSISLARMTEAAKTAYKKQSRTQNRYYIPSDYPGSTNELDDEDNDESTK